MNTNRTRPCRTPYCTGLIGHKNKSGLCQECAAAKRSKDPTPAQIRAECLVIQGEWDDDEEQKRRGGRNIFVETREVRAVM